MDLTLRYTNIAFVYVALAALLISSPASADPRSAELRFQLLSASYRWSQENPNVPEYNQYNQYGRKSLYVSPGIGGRYFPRHGNHGGLADIEYRTDLTSDDPWCLFGVPDPCPRWRNDFAVMHVGYAYRHVVESRRHPHERFWAFTPNVSVAAGWAKNQPAALGIPERSPAVGARVGFDIDWHVHRFFMGWSIRYEALKQTQGTVGWSHFFAWNAIPVFQIGVALGAARPIRPISMRFAR
jgi:hypothetical protein